MEPPRWLDLIRTDPRCSAYALRQLEEIEKAYRAMDPYACPAINPLLKCGNCGQDVMLQQEPQTLRLELSWWEVDNCDHRPAHQNCLATFKPHSRLLCELRQLQANKITGRLL